MDINPSVTIDDPALDAQIDAADTEQYEARKRYAALLGQKIDRLLRAVFPQGGTLHLERWTEAGEVGITLQTITFDDRPYTVPEDGDTDPQRVMGADSYDQLVELVYSLSDTGVALNWKYGTATLDF